MGRIARKSPGAEGQIDVPTVRLGTGHKIQVDAQDLHLLWEHRWLINSGPYITARVRFDRLYLHRLIMQPGSGLEVDHIDGDPTNCRRSNMRVCTHADNMRNRRGRSGKQTPYKGVFPSGGKYRARICHNYRVLHVGLFTTALEAARAYDAAATKLQGEFARLNFAKEA
jgi:hypothetical protein